MAESDADQTNPLNQADIGCSRPASTCQGQRLTGRTRLVVYFGLIPAACAACLLALRSAPARPADTVTEALKSDLVGLRQGKFVVPADLMSCPGGRATRRTRFMTSADYDSVVDNVLKELSKLSSMCSRRSCPQADFAGCVLRMTGHDFMDFHLGKGGSDGCTDLSDPDNKGLPECLKHGEKLGGTTVSLQNVYQLHCTKISLADFLVIAAEGLMTNLRPPGGVNDVDFKSNFRYGRETSIEDCERQFFQHILPDAEGSCEEVDRVFVRNMRLTKSEATALSGVHTLGRAKPENSGYDGWWSDPGNSKVFNNNYFVSILAKGWAPKKNVGGNPKKNMWVLSDVNHDKFPDEIMLNTDICLAYFEDGESLKADKHDCCAWMNPEFSKGGRKVGLPPEVTIANAGELCGHAIVGAGAESRSVCCETFGRDKALATIDCGSPVTPNGFVGEEIIRFAQDEKYWLRVFQTAWTKATENGWSRKLKRL